MKYILYTDVDAIKNAKCVANGIQKLQNLSK